MMGFVCQLFCKIHLTSLNETLCMLGNMIHRIEAEDITT